jgi:hypothetical protein
MNIFIISASPHECAIMLDDKRLVKMTTETAQMLSSALSEYNAVPFYKRSHANHPCSKWVGASRENFMWTIQLLSELNSEYVRRYNKDVNHLAYTKAISACVTQIDKIPEGQLTPFVNCSLFKDESDVIKAYKKTMVQKWTEFKQPPRWTNAIKPTWAIL